MLITQKNMQPLSGAEFWEHGDYGGNSDKYVSGDEKDNIEKNDSYDSAKVAAGCQATVYEHRDYGGIQAVWPPKISADEYQVPEIKNWDLADDISGVKVKCYPDKVSELCADCWNENKEICKDQPKCTHSKPRDVDVEFSKDYTVPLAGAKLFHHQNYEGDSKVYEHGGLYPSLGVAHHNRFDSAIIAPGCRLKMYEGYNFESNEDVKPSQISVKPTAISQIELGDDVKSVKVECDENELKRLCCESGNENEPVCVQNYPCTPSSSSPSSLSSPSSPPSSPRPGEDGGNGKPDTSTIVGISVGVAVVLSFIAAVAYGYKTRKKRRQLPQI